MLNEIGTHDPTEVHTFNMVHLIHFLPYSQRAVFGLQALSRNPI